MPYGSISANSRNLCWDRYYHENFNNFVIINVYYSISTMLFVSSKYNNCLLNRYTQCDASDYTLSFYSHFYGFFNDAFIIPLLKSTSPYREELKYRQSGKTLCTLMWHDRQRYSHHLCIRYITLQLLGFLIHTQLNKYD
jgi:hypothetical protein